MQYSCLGTHETKITLPLSHFTAQIYIIYRISHNYIVKYYLNHQDVNFTATKIKCFFLLSGFSDHLFKLNQFFFVQFSYATSRKAASNRHQSRNHRGSTMIGSGSSTRSKGSDALSPVWPLQTKRNKKVFVFCFF